MILGQSIIGGLNYPGAGFWNGTLADAINLDRFLGLGYQSVSSVSVSGAQWVSDGKGHSALNFVITTISDPVSAADITDALLALGGVLLIVIGAALALLGPPGWAADLLGAFLFIVGALAILSVSVRVVFGPGGPFSWVPWTIGISVAIFGSFFVYDAIKSPELRRQTYTAVGKAASKGASLAEAAGRKAVPLASKGFQAASKIQQRIQQPGKESYVWTPEE